MAEWISLIGKVPILKQVCQWVHKHLLEFLLERKRLTLVLSRQQASLSGKKLVTTLAVTNNTDRRVVVLYASEGRITFPHWYENLSVMKALPNLDGKIPPLPNALNLREKADLN